MRASPGPERGSGKIAIGATGRSTASATRRSAPRSTTPSTAGTKASPKRTRSSARRAVTLLAGGNPQIAKADGDAPVQAYIEALTGWKRELTARVDALVVRSVPAVRKAVRWNSPMYGVAGQGWFLSLHVFTHYLKVTFFKGTSLRPEPPGGTGQDARWIDLHEGELDEVQLARWIRQAAALPGWAAGGPS